MLKIYYFQMTLNNCEMWSNGVKTAFFKKLQKIAQWQGASPQTPISSAAGGSAPRPHQWYFWITVHIFTKHVSQFRHFHISTIGLSPSLGTSPLLCANTGPRFLIFHCTISLPPQKIPPSKFLMASLHVIRGLGPLTPIKSLGYAYERV